MVAFLLVVIGYLLGAVPVGLLVGRAFGADVRSVGSGNIGTANVLRAAGRGAAILTMAGDMLKGVIPVLLARTLTANEWILAGVALAAVIGHCWPVFLRFKGGKGVATGAGASIALAPLVGAIMFCVWWAIALATRYTSLAAILVMILGPFIFLLFSPSLPYVLFAVVGGLAVLYRHRENIRSLVKGTERKVGQKAPNEDSREPERVR